MFFDSLQHAFQLPNHVVLLGTSCDTTVFLFMLIPFLWFHLNNILLLFFCYCVVVSEFLVFIFIVFMFMFFNNHFFSFIKLFFRKKYFYSRKTNLPGDWRVFGVEAEAFSCLERAFKTLQN